MCPLMTPYKYCLICSQSKPVEKHCYFYFRDEIPEVLRYETYTNVSS